MECSIEWPIECFVVCAIGFDRIFYQMLHRMLHRTLHRMFLRFRRMLQQAFNRTLHRRLDRIFRMFRWMFYRMFHRKFDRSFHRQVRRYAWSRRPWSGPKQDQESRILIPQPIPRPDVPSLLSTTFQFLLSWLKCWKALIGQRGLRPNRRSTSLTYPTHIVYRPNMQWLICYSVICEN